MREINEAIIHCSATKPSMDIGSDWIRKIHVQQNKWKDIGYHFVIRRDGTIENGRPIEQVGAHCEGHNSKSIGVCMVGGLSENGKAENNFTPEQFSSVQNLIYELKNKFGIVKLNGHNDYANKACPCFNVHEKLKL